MSIFNVMVLIVTRRFIWNLLSVKMLLLKGHFTHVEQQSCQPELLTDVLIL